MKLHGSFLVLELSLFLLFAVSVSSFLLQRAPGNLNYYLSPTNTFAKDPARSYGIERIHDVIDEQGAMEAFFSAREEWLPIFRTLAGSWLPVNTESLLSDLTSNGSGIPNSVTNGSRVLNPAAIPEDPDDRDIIEGCLAKMHKFLVDIPVTDSKRDGPLENENDLQFLEEGRRMLAINRFHVMRDNFGGSLEAVDALFANCWTELLELNKSTDGHTGSIIFLPQYSSLSDLHRFTDMNLVRPLDWLGRAEDFEVASLEDYGSPAIRILYKLRDMPEGEIKVHRFGEPDE